MEPQAAQAWSALEARMREEGLNLWLVRPMADLEPSFAAKTGAIAALSSSQSKPQSKVQSKAQSREPSIAGLDQAPGAPSANQTSYKSAVLLGSAGVAFWERSADIRKSAEPNPLDRHTERTVEAALDALRPADASVVSAYPFAHERCITPFLAFFKGTTLLQYTPFGVSLHDRYGPWFAWRAALLTRIDLPPSPLATASPCESCPAPCQSACPVGAVAKSGFNWQGCVNHRVAEVKGHLGEKSCRNTCLAREACPVAPEHRYTNEQLAYHYGISLRSILEEGWADREPAGR